MRHLAKNSIYDRQSRGGFTLVEMLVSVALVLLIMTLFAEAFGIAASSIRTQRGIAENDQRARSMITVLLGDLKKRTFRQRDDAITENVYPPDDIDPAIGNRLAALQNFANKQSLGLVPLHPDYFIGGAPRNLSMTATFVEGTDATGAAFRHVDKDRERGYLSISEGTTTDDSDDVLQFTIRVPDPGFGVDDSTRLTGRAQRLGIDDASRSTWDNSTRLPDNLDQPIWDDWQGYQLDAGTPRSYASGERGQGVSRFAEVSYFIRDGKLRRRVLLIRDPLPQIDNADIGNGQPHAGNGDESNSALIEGAYDTSAGSGEDGSPSTGLGLSDFWNDFDYGATFLPATPILNVNVWLTERASLDNTTAGVFASDSAYLGPRPLALGNPQMRFGHDAFAYDDVDGLQGRPKEYYDPSDVSTFIGRYTHEETSSAEFRYPGIAGYNANPAVSPMRFGALPGITDAIPKNNRVDLFEGGDRAGEDILLSNCHAFDVKVWDSVINDFVDIGHLLSNNAGTPADPSDDIPGDWSEMHVNTVPQFMNAGMNIPGRHHSAQFGQPGIGMGAYGGLTATAASPNHMFDTWHPMFNFTKDAKPNAATTPNFGVDPGDPIARPDNDPPPHRPLWTDHPNFDTDSDYQGGFTGAGNLSIRFWEPDRDYALGDRVFPRPNIVDGTAMPPHMSFFYELVILSTDPGDDGYRSNALEQPNWPESPGANILEMNITTGDRLVWKAIPNVIGLKAIQISVRFYDPTSGQIRQLTLTHSFVEL